MLCKRKSHSTISQLYFKNKQTHRKKEIRSVIIRGMGRGKRELDAGDQKVQTYNYKINQYSG